LQRHFTHFSPLPLHGSAPPHALHSFPTRRSSDLRAGLERSRNAELTGERNEFQSVIDQLLNKKREGEDVRTTLDPKGQQAAFAGDRKSTRLNSSHVAISYAVFCLKKKKQHMGIHL